MSQSLPDFETPPETPAPPKKPRRKPTKRRVRKVAAPVPKKRRKRRVAKSPLLAAPYGKNKHAGGRYSKDVYAAIAALLLVKKHERDAVFDIVQGLTDGRAG